MRVPPIVDDPTPRITGNSFLHLWRAEDFGGGPGNTGIVQHPGTGHMYVGNSHGVLEYDGARWQLLPLPHAGAVLALAVDARGRVWAAAENEIVRLEPTPAGALHAVTVVYPLPDGETGTIDQALATADGVWFRGLQHVLCVGSDGKVATWRSGERFGVIWWMNGAVHAKVSEREVVRLDPGGKLTLVISRTGQRMPPPNRPSPFRVYAARPAGDNEWILLTALGPARYRSDSNTWRAFATRPPLFREAEAVAATFLDDGAMVFVTTRPGGVVLSADGRVERLLDRFPTVMNPRVSSLATDREGGLWITSRDHVARLQLRSAFARHEGAQGLQGNPRQVLRHRDMLFVAHSGGVSHHIEWPGAFPPADGLHRGADALTVVNDRLFAAATGLVEVIHGGLGARPLSNLAITTVSGVAQRPDTLLGGDAGGVWVFESDGPEWRPAGRLEHLEVSIGALFDAGDGWVWGATTNGRLWRADFRGGVRLDAPVTFYGPERGVPADVRLGRVHFFTLGDAIIATSGRWLLRHDPATDRFVPEMRIAGVVSPNSLGAEAVGSNSDGSRWLRMAAPDRRLLRVIPDGPGRWRSEELAAPLIRDLAAVNLYQDGRTLWIAGKDLLVSADLEWQSPQDPPPLVTRLRRVLTSERQVLWQDGNGVPTGALALPVGKESLRFEFAASSFVTDYRGRPIVRYRTQLVGLEREWSAWSAEPWRDFTKLPAGRYTFRMQATDQAGRTSAESTLALVITAPWWRSRWAWAGYTTLAAFAVAGLVMLRTRALRRRAAQLEQIVAARTEQLRRSNTELARLHQLELDEKSAAQRAEEEARLEVLRYQLNPHFLYNTLNSIYSLVLTAPPAAANMVLRLADFCRVALDRRHEEHTTVGAEFDKLTNYLEIEKVRWGDSLHVAVEAGDAARRATLPPFLLLPLVENAIKYGGATSPDELHVRVSARCEPDGSILISVANTGTWVERSAAAPHASHSGIGLTNLRQRLQRYHPNAHAISVDAADGWVVVTLRLFVPRGPQPSPAAPAAAVATANREDADAPVAR